MEDEEVRILFDQSTETGIKKCNIIADNDHEERHLLEVRDKIIALFGPAAIVAVTTEGLNSLTAQNEPEATTDLFATGGC
jgi:hypothetical protein